MPVTKEEAKTRFNKLLIKNCTVSYGNLYGWKDEWTGEDGWKDATKKRIEELLDPDAESVPTNFAWLGPDDNQPKMINKRFTATAYITTSVFETLDDKFDSNFNDRIENCAKELLKCNSGNEIVSELINSSLKAKNLNNEYGKFKHNNKENYCQELSVVVAVAKYLGIKSIHIAVYANINEDSRDLVNASQTVSKTFHAEALAWARVIQETINWKNRIDILKASIGSNGVNNTNPLHVSSQRVDLKVATDITKNENCTGCREDQEKMKIYFEDYGDIDFSS